MKLGFGKQHFPWTHVHWCLQNYKYACCLLISSCVVGVCGPPILYFHWGSCRPPLATSRKLTRPNSSVGTWTLKHARGCASSSQTRSWRGGRQGVGTILPLAQELVPFDSCWGKDCVSLNMWSLLGPPHPRSGPTPKSSWAAQIELQSFKSKQSLKLVGQGGGVEAIGLGRSLGVLNLIKIYCMKFSIKVPFQCIAIYYVWTTASMWRSEGSL